MKRHTGPPAPCANCDQTAPIIARRLCGRCYSRLQKRGAFLSPTSHFSLKFPPTSSRGTATYTILPDSTAARRALQYRQLTASGPGSLSRRRACIVLGITVRTAYRYEAWLRSQAADKKDED